VRVGFRWDGYLRTDLFEAPRDNMPWGLREGLFGINNFNQCEMCDGHVGRIKRNFPEPCLCSKERKERVNS
jgi:hypothetical protein